MDLLKSESNISSIVNVLKELCCCCRCILRFLGVQHSEVGSAYKNPLDYLNKLIAAQQPEIILDIVNESSPKKQKPNVCPVCLDCFREETIEKLVKDVDSLGLEHFNYNNFVFNVSFPKCLAIRAHSMLLHLRNHFPVFESVNLYDAKASPLDEVLLEQPHKIFRAVAVDILSKVLNKQYYPKAHLNLLISIKYEKDDEEVENMKNLIRNKRSKKHIDISRNNILEHLKDVQDKLFTQHFTIPPVIPDHEVRLERVQVTTDPIFIGGRYLKFKRNVGQTPWIVDGVSVTEHNVQDIVFDAIFNVLRCEKKHMTFSASGREDVDVRMLGTGRPFYIKIDNAKQRQFSSEQLREVERQVIKSELVAVTKLQSIFSSDLTRIKTGEESKRKTYKALCKTAAPNIQAAIDLLNKQSEVTVAQLTVMRVLHRRTLMSRDKTIYSMFATEVPGHSDLFELEVVTQAGTYVKEFVHGDFERTHPSCKSDDGFPPYLCSRCTSSLIDFFNFKIKLQKTDLYVRTLLGKTFTDNFSDVKSESNADDFMLDEKYGLLQAQCDSQDDNYLDVKGNNVIPDINSLRGIPSPYCSACLLKFNDIGECETHMAKAHGKNPFAKYCLFRKQIADRAKAAVENRKKRRFEEYSLKQEILRMKPGKLCRICKEKFPENKFKAHWDSHKTHVCGECGHKCVKRSDLKIHKLSVHNDVRNFSCALCDKSFKTKPLLKRHQVVHLNLRMHCCDLCGQRFNDRGTLGTHIQLKHIRTRDFICPICGLAFPMKSTLDKHILRHNKNRPPSFYCDVCSSAFKDKSSLKRHHLVKHSNNFVKPACQYCGKSYCSNTKLRYHIERHHSGNVVERQKRAPRTLREAEFSLTESEDSNDIFEDTSQRRSIATNVRDDFYPSSPRYQDDQTEDDPDYVAYQRALQLEETESEHLKSDSD